jgi:hypothetical protein
VVDRHLAAAAALGATGSEVEALLEAEGFDAVHLVTTSAGAAGRDEVAILQVRRPPTRP